MHTTARGFAAALVSVALGVAVIGSLGAPLITSVALDLDVPLDAAQWTLTVTLFAGSVAGPLVGRLGSGPRPRRTVLVGLGAVVAGGVLTVVPIGPGPSALGVLLVGRALQGLGFAAVPVLMRFAREHLPEDRSASTIAAISVASTVGIGVGYPLMGLVDEWAGLRAAYALGLVLSIAALAVAARALPRDADARSPRIDLPGALLLSLGTLGLLLVVAERSVWSTPLIGVAILVLAGAALVVWWFVERRSPHPLVDPGAVGRPDVVRANAAMFVSGIGMYLLFSLLTRYVQTPVEAGYGFGWSGPIAGAALIPFSVLGFVAGRFVPGAVARFGTRRVFVGTVLPVVAAAGLFAVGTTSPVAVLGAMALLGAGVGGVSAVMPKLLLTGVDVAETASVLSVGQVVRPIGFSFGSAFAGVLLAIATPSGATLPVAAGFVDAAWWAVPLAVLAVLVVVLRRTGPTVEDRAEYPG